VIIWLIKATIKYLIFASVRSVEASDWTVLAHVTSADLRVIVSAGRKQKQCNSKKKTARNRASG
jgi:hypothetical protein